MLCARSVSPNHARLAPEVADVTSLAEVTSPPGHGASRPQNTDCEMARMAAEQRRQWFPAASSGQGPPPPSWKHGGPEVDCVVVGLSPIGGHLGAGDTT